MGRSSIEMAGVRRYQEVPPDLNGLRLNPPDTLRNRAKSTPARANSGVSRCSLASKISTESSACDDTQRAIAQPRPSVSSDSSRKQPESHPPSALGRWNRRTEIPSVTTGPSCTQTPNPKPILRRGSGASLERRVRFAEQDEQIDDSSKSLPSAAEVPSNPSKAHFQPQHWTSVKREDRAPKLPSSTSHNTQRKDRRPSSSHSQALRCVRVSETHRTPTSTSTNSYYISYGPTRREHPVEASDRQSPGAWSIGRQLRRMSSYQSLRNLAVGRKEGRAGADSGRGFGPSQIPPTANIGRRRKAQ